MDIGSLRLLDIKVILDDKETIFEGSAESAPEEIRKLQYSKVKMAGKVELYVYSSNFGENA